jgi:DNA-binding MarR family transcriptional regulator
MRHWTVSEVAAPDTQSSEQPIYRELRSQRSRCATSQIGYHPPHVVSSGLNVPPRKNASVGMIYLLKRAELAVRSCAEAALVPFRLTPTQFLLLHRLQESTGVSSAELARAIGVRPQSIVDLIGPLEQEGLIKRREAPEHRRILRITLSAAGKRLLAQALPVARQLEEELLRNLNTQETAHLRGGLTKLLANAQAHETHQRVVRRSAASMREGVARLWRPVDTAAQPRRRVLAPSQG